MTSQLRWCSLSVFVMLCICNIFIFLWVGGGSPGVTKLTTFETFTFLVFSKWPSLSWWLNSLLSLCRWPPMNLFASEVLPSTRLTGRSGLPQHPPCTPLNFNMTQYVFSCHAESIWKQVLNVSQFLPVSASLLLYCGATTQRQPLFIY